MRFEKTAIEGVCLIRPEEHKDERGSFTRIFDAQEFAAQKLVHSFVQSSLSFNKRQGTLRGLHFQKDPKAETKLVRCVRGALYDVVLDLRQNSPTYRAWTSIELNPENRLAIFIPAGCAHGFQTLRDDTELLYQMDQPYAPELAGGVRWNDPGFHIRWPLPTPILSERDRAFPDYV